MSAAPSPARRPWLLWVPLIGFILLATIFIIGLRKPDDPTITSKMIGRPMPAFALPAATSGVDGLTSADLATGTPHLVNIFASWCVPCAGEAPQLEILAKNKVPIVGIAIRDRPDDVAGFLARYGNPYARIGSDTTSKVQIAIGSSGVPETFVVDGKGVIRMQKIGPIMPEDLPGVQAALEAAR
ncbi:DsbE family thiol:disulfide interchange protein [Sphingomonas sp. AP4-R1]|uniref:DsbE family thiol:disulfide interchange protein n=1 Tax=Sphingomonas sp. AP4-R1 TaxID=2735134 RepID=UPI00149365F6|nr:DsbE family thiol:disulfide interchange protein [Sphingomonas sp. AP4-R1]QJU59002.1 DsbE family thiol:disulfide interchange protein [Sphingomonas sp. AP4-R1]